MSDPKLIRIGKPRTVMDWIHGRPRLRTEYNFVRRMPEMTNIIRRFHCEEEWEPVDEPTVRRIFGQVFTDPDLAMQFLFGGGVVETNNARYVTQEAKDAKAG